MLHERQCRVYHVLSSTVNSIAVSIFMNRDCFKIIVLVRIVFSIYSNLMSQQPSVTPSFVGQQFPFNPSSRHFGFAEHDEELVDEE